MKPGNLNQATEEEAVTWALAILNDNSKCGHDRDAGLAFLRRGGAIAMSPPALERLVRGVVEIVRAECEREVLPKQPDHLVSNWALPTFFHSKGESGEEVYFDRIEKANTSALLKAGVFNPMILLAHRVFSEAFPSEEGITARPTARNRLATRIRSLSSCAMNTS